MTAAPERLRVVFIYAGTVAPDHGGKRILEQMAWLAAAGWDVSLAPVVSSGEPEPELTPQIEQAGIRRLRAVEVAGRNPTSNLLPGAPRRCLNLAHVESIARDADWVVVGNTALAGSPEFIRCIRRTAAVISWDGDSLSRWHRTYAKWLHRREPARAGRRVISGISAARFEARVLRGYDFVTVPGPADLVSLERNSVGESRILVVPNVVRIAQSPTTRNGSQRSLEALFVGSDYAPNIEGLRWLLANVWPGVKDLRPAARLVIAGRDLRRETILSTSSAPSGVEFIGKVADIQALYRSAAVVLAPLFFGSGVPNKVLEALATDSALVLTPYVAEALGQPDGLRPVQSASGWIEAVVSALDDPDRERIDPGVRDALIAEHGPAGFDRAMRVAVTRVRELRSQ